MASGPGQELSLEAKEDLRHGGTADGDMDAGQEAADQEGQGIGGLDLAGKGDGNYPFPNRWWQMVEKYGINILYTAPTAIRGLMRYGENWPNRHDLSSLRLLGSVGEPINPEAWKWYHRVIGKGRCPIMDTWWQTETGMFMITPMPCVPLKPGSGTRPFPELRWTC